MSTFGDNSKEVGEAMRELLAVLEKVSGKKITELIKALPTVPDNDIKERLMAGMLLVTLDEKDEESEKVQMSSGILISLLAEIYRWREMFGSINLLEGKKND